MEEENEQCLAEDAPSVLPIDRKTVHQICSGQVVLNLATAVKELLENSLDAGATSVEIRLKENGAEIVEVSDNGCGVEPHNFAALTLKHHTSKLRNFSDLSSVETFGFRGEALSSLCAVSNVTITTRHKSQVAGTRLVYDYNGKLQSQAACARQQGTTVTLCSLFSTLPVRHKEFLHNIKKELVKLVHVLHGYCIISNGVRITCTNQVEKGRKSTIVSTLGSEQIKDNIACLFGQKQVQLLMPFNQVQPSQEECNEYIIKTENQSNVFHITGFVSKAGHGMGRSSADRQFLFINKRPCDLIKVSRVVNEVYHMFNRHQYPFIVLNISLERDIVDVNVTPDKRKVFMQEEKLLLATIKSSLKTMFDPGTSNYEVNQKPLSQLSFETMVMKEETTENCTLRQQKATTMTLTEDSHKKGFPLLSSFKRPYSAMSGKTDYKKEPKAKQAKLTTFCSSVVNFGTKVFGKTRITSDEKTDKRGAKSQECEMEKPDEEAKVETVEHENVILVTNDSETRLLGNDCAVVESKPLEEGQTIISLDHVNGERRSTILPSKKTDHQKNTAKKDFVASLEHRKVIPVDFKIQTLREFVSRSKSFNDQRSKSRIFRAKITPENNAAAEDELTKNINKDSFSKMDVLGQFNLGFIITKLEDDIFIIDQHASDEKYNFENQQKNTTLQTQRLIFPKKLELTAVNECVLIDNIEIFRQNGFDFEIDDEAQISQKVKLVSVPVSKNWTFGVEDVEELIFMLSDSPGVICRPTRVRKMFASRACRMSTMIGTALSREEMKTIVRHMGQMDHPWNCPHGRPTMRHVINVNMISPLAMDTK